MKILNGMILGLLTSLSFFAMEEPKDQDNINFIGLISIERTDVMNLKTSVNNKSAALVVFDKIRYEKMSLEQKEKYYNNKYKPMKEIE
jgi:hypothetical protein